MATQPLPEQIEGEEAQPEGMDDTELLSILGQHEAQAIGYTPGGNDEISEGQSTAIKYYYGQMDDVPAEDGCSKVTDRTVQTLIDNALAAVLKPFVSSDETVMFAPRGPEDVETAEQATEYVNYIFNVDNPGFLILHNWFKDAMLSKLGVVKVWWEEQPRDETQEIPLGDEMQANYVRSQAEYLGEKDGVAIIGRMVPDGRVRVACVPPEEFRVSKATRQIEDAPYSAHCPNDITRSDLIEMGIDPAIVASLPAIGTAANENTIRQARYDDEDITDGLLGSQGEANDILALRDEYVRIDYDGDGVAELRRILRVENTILLNEVWDENPFATLCPVPMPHKLHGLSLADLGIELQKIATVLWRQMLDNLYKSNNPRPVLGQGADRPDGSTAKSLTDNAPGAAIFVADITQFRFDAVPYTADASLPMLEMVDKALEERTGISRAGQGLDTNSLRKSGQMTATEMAMIAGAKNARVEMMARIFAETGVKRLFRLIYKLVCAHQPQERVIRLRKQWVTVDPRNWPEMDVEISVGLGVGEKSEQIAIADGILEAQAALVQSPYANMVSAENVYNALGKKLNAGGIKNIEEYFTPPEELQDQPEKPSPEEQKVQAEMQLQGAKLQGEQQLAAMKLQNQREEAMLKQQLAREEAEFEAGLAVEKMDREFALAERKMEKEAQLAEKKAAADAQRRQSETEAKISQNRPGGDLDK